MIKQGDTEGFTSERTLDIAPRGALLLAIPATQSAGVQMRLARVGLVPRHAHREPTHEEFAEVHVPPLGAQQQVEVLEKGVLKTFRPEGDRNA